MQLQIFNKLQFRFISIYRQFQSSLLFLCHIDRKIALGDCGMRLRTFHPVCTKPQIVYQLILPHFATLPLVYKSWNISKKIKSFKHFERENWWNYLQTKLHWNPWCFQVFLRRQSDQFLRQNKRKSLKKACANCQFVGLHDTSWNGIHKSRQRESRSELEEETFDTVRWCVEYSPRKKRVHGGRCSWARRASFCHLCPRKGGVPL